MTEAGGDVWGRMGAALGDAAPADLVVGALALSAIALIAGLFFAVRVSLRAATRDREAAAMQLAAQIAALSDGQQRLAGALSQGLTQSGDASARAQVETLGRVDARLDAVTKMLGESVTAATRAMETRLAETHAAFGESLSGSAEKTAQSLGALTERLEAIDRAQSNIEKLSGDVLGLQDILANKQARGRFGEIQLNDLIIDALPPSAYAFQAPLSNGRRVDALLKLPDPPGAVAVDAKFPLEPFEALRRAETQTERSAAERAIRQALRTHVDAVAERYVAPGETADGALMFLPSEAIYAELHASFPEVVRDAFAKRVWIVSPTTLMATLLTMRAILRDATIRERSSDLRREIGLLAQDVERLAERSEKLRGVIGQTDRVLDDVAVSAGKALRRARRLSGAEAETSEIAAAPDAPTRLTS